MREKRKINIKRRETIEQKERKRVEKAKVREKVREKERETER